MIQDTIEKVEFVKHGFKPIEIFKFEIRQFDFYDNTKRFS
ncbi:hypothetical protein ATE84_2691 [Aquimarina sp. MAR_2010_214]|nr:hypothetical protein ATE84_2691 [Aquimarina sp. MAR_2010_214]